MVIIDDSASIYFHQSEDIASAFVEVNTLLRSDPKEYYAPITAKICELLKHVVIEPLTTSEEEANKWADLAVKYKIDGILGYFYPTVCEKLNKAGVFYFPPFGNRDEDMRLLGSLEFLKEDALRIISEGSSGLRISAFRWVDGKPEVLARTIKEALEPLGKPFMMTGSVNDFSRLDFIKEMQPWGITVGGALFDEGKFGGGTVAERIDRIDTYCNG